MSDSATMPAAALRRTDLPKLSLGTKTAATLRISLSGYYDMVLARPGDQMTGTWNIGEIKAEDFTKIPTSRAIELNVAYLEPVAGQDKTERIELDSLDNIDLTVKSGGKKKEEYMI